VRVVTPGVAATAAPGPFRQQLGAARRSGSVGEVRQDAAVAPPSIALDTAELRKARGAFFTPEPVARFITDWAVRSPADRVLEPSCGEASFLLAAVDRLTALRRADQLDLQLATLDGVELHKASADAARALLRGAGVDARIEVGDFFCVDPTGSYDVVIGNPPFIRYQDFSGEARARSRAAALRAGVGLTNLASSWAAFAVHAALFLRPGGRMGLVLPAELLSVNYAGQVRRFLLESFASVELVLFDERVFPGVQEEVVLLLAEGYRRGPTDHASICHVRNAAGLSEVLSGRKWQPVRPEDKWTASLLSADAATAYGDLAADHGFTVLETWGDTTLGMVTGNNKFFTLSPKRVAELELRPSDLLRLSPPGSRHLRGLALSSSALDELGRHGAATWLFRPGGEPSSAAWTYIGAGEAADVHTAYKCRVRTPWWRVPYVPPADLLLTYMNADTPRLSTNESGVGNLNSVHGVYLRPDVRVLGSELLPLASLTSMTLVGAEIVGRAYGGGLLKVEPKEADKLPVPARPLVEAAAKRLREVRSQVAELLEAGQLLDAVALVDDILLIGELGVPLSELRALRDAYTDLAARRTARGIEAKARP
jgi:adenine-specific DNA-methyltransferase